MSGFAAVPVRRVVEFWDRRPCNSRHSPKPIGSRGYFDDVQTRRYFVEPHISGFADFERWRGKHVLEIGCGIGTDTINFARHGADVTAVDVSERSLELARRQAEAYGLEDRITFYAGNAEELTAFVPVEPYDLIYSFGVIHHTPRPERVIEQLRPYAKAGTSIKIMLYHRRSWKVLGILLASGWRGFAEVDKTVARHSEAQTGCPITYTYLPAEVRELLRGFKVRAIQVAHIFPYRVQDYVNYRYVKVWYFRIMPQPLFRWLERRFGWHLCITAEAV